MFVCVDMHAESVCVWIYRMCVSVELNFCVCHQPPYPYVTSADHLRLAGEIITVGSGVFFFLSNVREKDWQDTHTHTHTKLSYTEKYHAKTVFSLKVTWQLHIIATSLSHYSVNAC